MKSLLKISLFLILSSDLIASPSAIKPSKAILESNVGEMEVEMKLLDNGLWKLTSLLDGGSIVRSEESEIFELIENKIKPLIAEGKNILIAAHGNSLRSLIKELDNLSDDEIVKLEIPTGAPIIYSFREGLIENKEELFGNQ